MKEIDEWFASRGWLPFDFQRQTWAHYLAGKSGLIHAPTGYGKTYAAWFAAIAEWMKEPPEDTSKQEPLRVLWITPLRALSNDTAESLRYPIAELKLPWTVERRTGDASAGEKARALKKPPTALITTPESLSLLLSYPEAKQNFSSLRMVVVDEWHEQLGTKRGVLTELALARLRMWIPALRVWGISATLGNVQQALEVLLGESEQTGELVAGLYPKSIEITTLLPEEIEHFPWAGHLGTKLAPKVVDAIEQAHSTIFFTNTRSQAELWYQAILNLRPDWEHQLALHHGSLEKDLRAQYEDALRRGEIKCVVCTSSLDLGVDFSPVDQVMQLGSPKGVARLMQRAGRSGHQPGATSRIICVPSHAIELVEFAAARDAVAERRIESREPIERPLDVLVQHLVTSALAGGFVEKELKREVRTTHAYRHLSDREWQWAMDFVTHGGRVLSAYPQYQKLVEIDGRYVVESRQIARFHRMSIGTIASDEMVRVKYQGGTNLGSVEESFVARMKPGEKFAFAGRTLEFIRLKDMTAHVRRASGTSTNVPRWMGGRLPLSSQLAHAVRRRLLEARNGVLRDPEMVAFAPIIEIQQRWSRLPVPDELLIEEVRTRDGTHHFLYPLAGRLVHEGMGPLLAYRLSKTQPRSFSIFQNDYGIELLTPGTSTITEEEWRLALSSERLVEDLLACMNASQLARQRFREIARVAGLVFQGFPGAHKSTRQLMASSGLLFDVFTQFDPENLLLEQAQREVLENQLEIRRMRRALEEIAAMKIIVVQPPRLTPLAFPLWVDRMRHQVSSESLQDRIDRMVIQLEKAAEGIVA